MRRADLLGHFQVHQFLPIYLSGKDVSVVELLLGVWAPEQLRPLEGDVLDALPVRLGREVGRQLFELSL